MRNILASVNLGSINQLFQKVATALGPSPEESKWNVRDIPGRVSLEFAPEINTPQKKVLATIWNQGQSNAVNIALCANLVVEEAEQIAEGLVKSGKLVKTDHPLLPSYDINYK